MKFLLIFCVLFSVSFAESIILFSKNSNCQDPHMAILQSPECKSWAMGFSKYTCSLNHPEKHHFHACSDSSCRNCHIFERSNACNPRFKSEVDQFSSILKKLNQTDSSEHREVKCGGKFIGALAILYKDTKCEEEEETFIQISRCQPGPVVSSRLECRGEGELVQHRYGTKDCSGEILSTRPFITRNCTNRVQIVKCGTLIFEPEK